MSPRQGLEVFLHGRHIGVLSGTSLKLAFQYDADVVAEYGAGTTSLSLSLPLSRKRFSGPPVYNYFDGLLPEGQVVGRGPAAAQSRPISSNRNRLILRCPTYSPQRTGR